MAALLLVVPALSASGGEPPARPPVTFRLKPVGYWVKQLKDSDSRTRQEAARVLAQLADDSKEARQALTGLLQAEDPALRRIAIRALVSLGQRIDDREVIEGLVKALDDDDAGCRANALFGLVEAGPRVAPVVPKLLPLFSDFDQTFREQVIFAVEKSGVKDEKVVLALARVILDDRPGARSVTAARALSNLGPEAKAALPLLKEGLKRKDAEVRGTVLGLLVVIDPMTAPLLVTTLKDSEPRMRDAARAALEALGPKAKAAIPALVRRLKDGEQAEETIRLLGGMGPDAAPALAEALREPDLGIVREAVMALKRLGPQAKAAAPALAAALRDPDIRHQAAEALRGIGGDAAPAVVPLLKEAGPVGEEAHRVLSQLGVAAIPALVEGLKDNDRALTLLADMGKGMAAAQAAVPLLIKKLKDTDPMMRQRAAQALGRMRSNALAAVEALEELKKESTGTLLRVVEEALSQIRGPR
jgi:HEAT repeat protein